MSIIGDLGEKVLENVYFEEVLFKLRFEGNLGIIEKKCFRLKERFRVYKR